MFSIAQSGNFEAAHYIRNPDTPDHYKHIHGHSFVVTVHASSGLPNEYGWVMDLGKLENTLKEVLALLDHKVLNEIEGLEPPTFENILIFIDKAFIARGVTLSRIDIARPTLGQSGSFVR